MAPTKYFAKSFSLSRPTRGILLCGSQRDLLRLLCVIFGSYPDELTNDRYIARTGIL